MRPIYMNYAGLAPITLRSYLASMHSFELFGNVFLLDWFKKVKNLKEKLADFFGCQTKQIAFVPSTTVALTLAANSLSWQKGDKVSLDLNDYPANVLCWKELEKFGVELNNHNTNTDYSNYKMLTISTVDYKTGIENDWQNIVREANKAGCYTCVDAIQSAGIKESWIPEIDFWCAGVQKWLVSGLGLAIIILSERVLNDLQTPFPSWLGLNDYQDASSGMRDTGQGWEFGWVSPAAISRLDSNIDYFLKLGLERISSQVKERRDRIHEHLLEMDFELASCPRNWSGIVSFNPGQGLAKEIVESGYKHKIITAERGEYIRISPHIFNSMSQIDKVCSWISQTKNKIASKGR